MRLPVLSPALELNLLPQQREEVVELGAPLGVGQYLVIKDLSAFRVDHSDLEIDGTLLLLEAEQVPLHGWMGDL